MAHEGRAVTPGPDPECQPVAGRVRSAPIAAAALALGKTVAAAAAEAGVSERTCYRWLRRPSFRRRVDRLRGAMVGEAVGKLSRSMSAAADVLSKLLTSRDPATRLRASKAVIELAVRLRDQEELAARLADLELRFAQLSQGEREAK
jgi:hypothetical protein